MTTTARSQQELTSSQIISVQNFLDRRADTESICATLEIEDQVVQPAPFVSPPKWHLAHTTWFFDCFILQTARKERVKNIEDTNLLFNSYYKSQGEHWPQEARGQLSRPTVREVLAWRRQVNDELCDLLEGQALEAHQLHTLSVGIQHEQQHQELLLMDIKYILGMQPAAPAYAPSAEIHNEAPAPLNWLNMPEGFYELGAGTGFSFDNERPRHRQWRGAHAVANRLITNAEFLEFVADDGYRSPSLWLSDGWNWVQQHKVNHPLYWRNSNDGWMEYQLSGLKPLELNLPVSHISYYEAEAFARWYGARLPDECELENFLHRYAEREPWNYGWTPGAPLYPDAATDRAGNGSLWQWTASAYAPYPGFIAENGALGEYNGKFMCNQYVLRGGCFATPRGHMRHSYRNFYRAHDRWAFTGIRLAKAPL